MKFHCLTWTPALLAGLLLVLSACESSSGTVSQPEGELAASGEVSVAAIEKSAAVPPFDLEYGKRIAEFTTDPRFLNELVDHLPASETVPSPLDHFGQIIGAPDKLHKSAEIAAYMRAVAAASPRVRVRRIGRSEGGKEIIEVVVSGLSDEQIEESRTIANRFADPRGLSEADAREQLEVIKPVYYLIGGLHSPETGPPEMLMELVYRLAVEESPLIRSIRDKVVVAIAPVVNPDGRDRMVDTYNWKKAHRDVGPGLRYWGEYVAHDNNRDGFGWGLASSKAVMGAYVHYKPIVMHDLHESVPYLYISTGTGPYNEYLDATTIDDWHRMAYHEVGELTRRGMPGVWTHKFYTGWAANYLMWGANIRNSIGRFYETFGNSGADTRVRKLEKSSTSREWFRPNPPLSEVEWSLRNNTNYMQSGVLCGLGFVAEQGQSLAENFWLRGKRAVERGRTQAPFAWVIPAAQKRRLAASGLVNLLLEQGVEVHVATQELSWKEGKKKRSEKVGAYVVRCDQPYRTLIRVLLDKQNYPADAEPPYDDTGWTLPYLYGVRSHRVGDAKILDAKMTRLESPVRVVGRVIGANAPFLLVAHSSDDQVSVFRLQLADLSMKAAEKSFKAGGNSYPAGSLVIPAGGQPADARRRIDEAAKRLGIVVRGVAKEPDVAMHELEVPRVALVHTWVATPQDAGWWRMGFDQLGIPYTHISEQDFAGDLSGFDVIVMPNCRAGSQTLVQGTTEAGDPIPWLQTEETPDLGRLDETDDMRRGMGFEGLARLASWIRDGGLFLTEGGTCSFVIDMAITRRVSIRETDKLVVRGAVLKARITDPASPIAYGYGKELPVYFSRGPVLRVRKSLGRSSIPDWLQDEIFEKETPRVVLSFAKEGLLMSGMLRGEEELVGAPVVVDVPVGKGHVVLFANRPFWRGETRGSHSLVLNALVHWNDLRAGWPERVREKSP